MPTLAPTFPWSFDYLTHHSNTTPLESTVNKLWSSVRLKYIPSWPAPDFELRYFLMCSNLPSISCRVLMTLHIHVYLLHVLPFQYRVRLNWFKLYGVNTLDETLTILTHTFPVFFRYHTLRYSFCKQIGAVRLGNVLEVMLSLCWYHVIYFNGSDVLSRQFKDSEGISKSRETVKDDFN